MKAAWDSYVREQLKTPAVRQAYDEETTALSIGLRLQRNGRRP